VKIAIGIPTCNRQYLLEIHARSLCSARLPADTGIIVIDDCSVDYDFAYLKSIYPEKSDIRRRSEPSGGADFAARDVIAQLVETGAEILVLLDSDLIVASDFLDVGVELLPGSDGILSLFNAPSHRAVGCRGPFLLKKTIGAAATLWRRDVAREMLDHVTPGPRFDWRFCQFLNDAGYSICVTKESRVQHLGFTEGQNSRFDGKGDIGLGFSDKDACNSYRLAEIILHYMQSGPDDLITRVTALEKRIRRIESLLGLTLMHRIRKFVQH
jgi:glycosyltransferase involved in cell wall biosynthesis